jgi:NADP-dependent 3-hydroxy acid dehydrogenase YdfG
MTILEGQTAIVTGGGSGVGAAVALALAAAKVNVCLVGRSCGNLEAVAQEARRHGVKATPYVTDLADEDDLDRLIGRLMNDLTQVDVLVQNAALYSAAAIADSAVKDFDRHYRTNLRAPYALTQGLLPKLKARGGQVVFINSSSGISAKALTSQYDATKHGLRALADSLRSEVNADGIRVLSVYLGQTATGMQSRIHEARGTPYDPERLLQPQDVASIILSALSMPSTAEITDIHVRPMICPGRPDVA